MRSLHGVVPLQLVATAGEEAVRIIPSLLSIVFAAVNNVNEASILAAFGATIEIAKTSDEADEKLRKGHFDLIISDVRREGQADRVCASSSGARASRGRSST